MSKENGTRKYRINSIPQHFVIAIHEDEIVAEKYIEEAAGYLKASANKLPDTLQDHARNSVYLETERKLLEVLAEHRRLMAAIDKGDKLPKLYTEESETESLKESLKTSIN